MNREQSIEFIQAIEDTKALERAITEEGGKIHD